MYLTIAKGGLTPDHLLIVPIGHFQSTIECPPEVTAEVNKFKTQLIKYFEAEGKAVVFFERNFKSPHLQVQVVPILKSSLSGLKLACLVSPTIHFELNKKESLMQYLNTHLKLLNYRTLQKAKG